jgi:hypothetical protein
MRDILCHSGYYKIISNTNQEIKFDLSGVQFLEEDVNCPLDFDISIDNNKDSIFYKKAFEMILRNLTHLSDKLQHNSRLSLDYTRYIVPINKQSFQNSTLWRDLDFEITDNFEIIATVMCVDDSFGYDDFLVWKYETIIDFKNEKIVKNPIFSFWNELQDLADDVFLLLNKDTNEGMNELMDIFVKSRGALLEDYIKMYFAPALEKTKKFHICRASLSEEISKLSTYLHIITHLLENSFDKSTMFHVFDKRSVELDYVFDDFYQNLFDISSENDTCIDEYEGNTDIEEYESSMNIEEYERNMDLVEYENINEIYMNENMKIFDINLDMGNQNYNENYVEQISFNFDDKQSYNSSVLDKFKEIIRQYDSFMPKDLALYASCTLVNMRFQNSDDLDYSMLVIYDYLEEMYDYGVLLLKKNLDDYLYYERLIESKNPHLTVNFDYLVKIINLFNKFQKQDFIPCVVPISMIGSD